MAATTQTISADKVAACLQDVSKNFSFDPEAFAKDSNKLLEVINEQVKSMVRASAEGLSTAQSKFKQILRMYESLLKDSKEFCRSFLVETERMNVLLEKWANACLAEKSFQDMRLWLRDQVGLQPEQLEFVLKLFNEIWILAPLDLTKIETQQLDEVLSKIPIGKRSTVRSKVEQLKKDMASEHSAERMNNLIRYMQQISKASEGSKKNLISIGERYMNLVKEIEIAAKEVKAEADKEFFWLMFAAGSAVMLTIGCAVVGCACPILVIAFGFTLPEVVPLAILSASLSAAALTSGVSAWELQKAYQQLRDMENTYAQLSKKIEIEQNLWSEIDKHFGNYINMINLSQDDKPDLVLLTPQSTETFQQNMKKVRDYLTKLNASIDTYLKAVESKHWEFLNTLL